MKEWLKKVGPRIGCLCEMFNFSTEDGTDSEAYGSAIHYNDLGRIDAPSLPLMGCITTEISFCPWCGNKLALILPEVKP